MMTFMTLKSLVVALLCTTFNSPGACPLAHCLWCPQLPPLPMPYSTSSLAPQLLVHPPRPPLAHDILALLPATLGSYTLTTQILMPLSPITSHLIMPSTPPRHPHPAIGPQLVIFPYGGLFFFCHPLALFF